MIALRARAAAAFPALAVPNYRRYIRGQWLSLVGTWMQMTAQSWLVLTLTDSSSALGLIIGLQTLPVLLLAPYGGVVADRVDKRRLMIILQTAMGVQALVLGLLTVTGAIRLWEVGALAATLGLNNAFENPARQSFMLELVGRESLRNAVSLNSTLVNVARVIGPAIGGLLIAGVGVGVCFLLNAASFVAVVATLLRLDVTLLDPSPPLQRGAGQLREGLRYVAGNRMLAVPLAMMGIAGVFAYEFQVTLPVLARGPLGQGAGGYGLMSAAMGVGAIGGGLLVAVRGRTGLRPLIRYALVFAVALGLTAAAPSLGFALVALVFAGAASVSFMATGNATLQLEADPTMRGRVMALWFVAFQGSTPIGGPLVGWLMSVAGDRWGLVAGALGCVLAALLGTLTLARRAGQRGREVTALAPRL
jgi:MFS family permease